MPRSSNGGVLDLAEVEPTPLKVRIPAPPWPRWLGWLARLLRRPTSRLYDMANPQALGALSLQRLVSRYKRAEELMATEDQDGDDLAEMMDLLVDTCQVVIPTAPRSVLVALGIHRQQQVIEAFFNASPGNRAQRRAEAKKATSASS